MEKKKRIVIALGGTALGAALKKLKEIVFEDIRKNNEAMFSNMSSKEKETLVFIVEKLLNNIQNKDMPF